MTALDIIKASLRMLGAGQSGYTLTTAEDVDSLQKLNGLLNLLSAERLVVEAIIPEVFSLVGGTTSYLIGVAQAFNTVRPTLITSAFLRDNLRDYPIEIVSKERYNAFGLKTIQTRPGFLYYQPTMPYGNVTLYPTPDIVYSLYINSLKPLTNFANTGITVALAPEYQLLLETNLALALAPEYAHLQVNPLVVQQARDSMNAIRALRLVNDMTPLTCDLALLAGPGKVDHKIIISGGY